MTIEPSAVSRAVSARLDEAVKFLCDLVAVPSLPGREAGAMALAGEAFERVGQVERAAMDSSLRDDPDYSNPIGDIEYDGRYNLRICVPGSGGGRKLLLNSHVDVVPVGENQPGAFRPEIKAGAVFGRGSCDAKGQVATIYLALAALAELGVKTAGDVIAHVVVEEENGGNGTLAMVRRGERADGCVVLEPTELVVMPSVRGALWYRIICRGKPGHPGRAGETESALKMAMRVIEILQGYHDRLLAASGGIELFDKFADPMPIVIGQLHAGNWAAAAPGEAMLEGILGLLANKTCDEVMKEITDAIRSDGGAELAEKTKVRFMYRHDPMVTPSGHPLVKGLTAACTAAGLEAQIDGMTASCDSWLYKNRLGIPTVVFGGGSLSLAHADDEHMPIDQLASAAEALVHMIASWCE